jgi:hypothetical protein
MDGSLKHFVVLFILLIFSGQNAYSGIPCSPPAQKSKQCFIKDQSPASVSISDFEDEAEDHVNSIDHSALIIFSRVETSITQKNFSPLISTPHIGGTKKNILHAVFRI